MGLNSEDIAHSIRISTGFGTSSEEALEVLDMIKQIKGFTV